jgi:hypothetical protein
MWTNPRNFESTGVIKPPDTALGIDWIGWINTNTKFPRALDQIAPSNKLGLDWQCF